MTSTRPRGPIQPDMTQLVRLTTIAAKTADQKPATRKPGKNQATSMIISALITSRNSPSVSKVMGRVRMMMIGRTKALTTPSRSAAAISVPVELNATRPIFEASQRPIATTAARIRNPSMAPSCSGISFSDRGRDPLGCVDSWDSLLGANQIQGCFWEAVLGVMDRLVLSDAAWERMAPLIIGRPDQKGSTGRDNRMFVEGVLWIVRTGSPWRDLPQAFGDWNSVFRRFSRWSLKGVWRRIFAAVSDDPDFEYLIIDSTIVRAPEHEDPYGRSRPGMSGAVHADRRSEGRCAASGRVDRGIARRGGHGRYSL